DTFDRRCVHAGLDEQHRRRWWLRWQLGASTGGHEETEQDGHTVQQPAHRFSSTSLTHVVIPPRSFPQLPFPTHSVRSTPGGSSSSLAGGVCLASAQAVWRRPRPGTGALPTSVQSAKVL